MTISFDRLLVGHALHMMSRSRARPRSVATQFDCRFRPASGLGASTRDCDSRTRTVREFCDLVEVLDVRQGLAAVARHMIVLEQPHDVAGRHRLTSVTDSNSTGGSAIRSPT